MHVDYQALLQIEEPQDYFTGLGNRPLPAPSRILLFVRRTKEKLQQEALQNRSHHRYVLAFNIETRGCVHLDNLVLPLRPGQALLIHPYQFHHFGQLASPSIVWLFCTFELEHKTVLEPLRNRVLDLGERALLAREMLLQEWHRCQDESLVGDLQDAQLQTALVRLLITLKQDLPGVAVESASGPRDNLVRTVNRLMSEWRGRTVLVADLAAELSWSASRLRTQFKEASGIPLGRYLQNFRLNRAMALLRTGDRPVAEVAIEAGFGSHQAFCRIFKQKTGHSPLVYRHRS